MPIQNLSHSVYSLWQKRELLLKAREEVARAKQENISLRQQQSAVKQPSYIETQARDKLLMTKPGEQIVVVGDNLIVQKVNEKSEKEAEKSHWRQWWELFFP